MPKAQATCIHWQTCRMLWICRTEMVTVNLRLEGVPNSRSESDSSQKAGAHSFLPHRSHSRFQGALAWKSR